MRTRAEWAPSWRQIGCMFFGSCYFAANHIRFHLGSPTALLRSFQLALSLFPAFVTIWNIPHEYSDMYVPRGFGVFQQQDRRIVSNLTLSRCWYLYRQPGIVMIICKFWANTAYRNRLRYHRVRTIPPLTNLQLLGLVYAHHIFGQCMSWGKLSTIFLEGAFSNV